MPTRSPLALRPFAAVAVAALLLASPAAASPPGWYATLTLGSSNASIPDAVVDVAGAGASSVKRDERDPGFKVLAGYRFSRHFAIEGGYAHLGEFRATRDVTAPAAGTLNADLRVIGLVIDGVGMLPLGRGFTAYGRIGALLSEVRTLRTAGGIAGTPPGASAASSHDGLDLKYGIGLQYDLGTRTALRAEIERVRNVGDRATTGQVDVELYSAGLVFRF